MQRPSRKKSDARALRLAAGGFPLCGRFTRRVESPASTINTRMAYTQHIDSSQQITARCAIVTLSDTRSESTDTSGQRIRVLLAQNAHRVASYTLVPDAPATFEPLLLSLLNSPDIDTILTNGGTGISRRDQTISIVEKHLTQ